MLLPLAAACFGPRRPKTAPRGWVNSGSPRSTSKVTDVESVWSGGGLPAREGIELAKATVASPIALMKSVLRARLNATVPCRCCWRLMRCGPSVPHTIDDARSLLDDHHIVVMGGTVPGTPRTRSP